MREDGTTGAGEFRRGGTTVLAAGIGIGAGVTGLPFYSVGLFMKPLAVDYGWSRAAISGAALCLQLGIVFSAPLIGRLIDRIGIRGVALISLAALALGFVGLSFVDGSLSLFFLSWLGLSLAGCGTTPVVWTRAVASRFARHRGLALGLMLLGTGLAGILAPLLLGPIVVTEGWRTGSRVLAGLIGLVALPLVALLLREPVSTDGSVVGRATGFGLGEAVRQSRFARIALAFFLIGLVVAGTIVHLVPLLVDRGLAMPSALHAAATLGFAVVAGRLVVGWLCDRFHAPYVAFCFLMLPVASFVLLSFHGPALAAVLLLGLAAGAEIDLLAYLASRSFGMRAYGEIYGWLLSIFSLGAGTGPVLIGLSFDRTGSYSLALITGACLIALGALLVATLGRFPTADELPPPATPA